MSVSYAISERYNSQTAIWAVAIPVYRAAVSIGNAYQAIRTVLPSLLFALAIFAKALGLVMIITGLVVVAACIPVTFWLGLAITSAFAYMTYPRTVERK